MSFDQRTISLGLVGAGRWGRNYIRTISKMNGAHLARLASRNPETAELVGPACMVSDDWRTLIEDTELDGLVLAVPPAAQVEIAMAALDKGLPLLLEKPLATSLADAERIASLAQQQGVSVLVDHIYLFHPAYAVLKREAEKLESIAYIRSTGGAMGPFREAWTALWDWGPHDLAMCLDLAGEFPSSISADHEEIATAEGTGDIFRLKLEFPSGLKADLYFGNAMANKTRRISVTGNGVEIVFDDLADTKVIRSEAGRGMALEVTADLALDRAVGCFVAGLRGGECSAFGTDLAVGVVRVLAEVERQCSFSGSSRIP